MRELAASQHRKEGHVTALGLDVKALVGKLPRRAWDTSRIVSISSLSGMYAT